MLSLSAIRVQNLRSLLDSGFIELKPINILVGRNSSGKSTFARILPLLRQSAEVTTRSPILWYGRYVDFGTLATAVNRNDTGKILKFSYRFIQTDEDQDDSHLIFDSELDYLFYRENYAFGRRQLNAAPGTVEIAVALRPTENEEAEISSLSVFLFGTTVEYHFDSQSGVSVKVNKNVVEIPSSVSAVIEAGELIPQVSLHYNSDSDSKDKFKRSFRRFYLFDRLVECVQSNLVHGNTTASKIREIVSQLKIGNDETLLESIKKARGPKSWKDAVKNLGDHDHRFIALKNCLFAAYSYSLLTNANKAVSKYVRNVRYLEPLRATAQRFYRRQDLAVNEIDSRGENVAMFLDSLTPSERIEFKKWSEDNLGFTVEAVREGGHVSVKLQGVGESVATNLADMGFGFSQFIPIAIELWSSTFRMASSGYGNRASRAPVLVVEQPELHLHPAFQAKIADLFVIASRNVSDGVGFSSIIAETHSPNLIYRLGELVELGLLAREDVQIVLFEQSHSSLGTTVSTAGFNEKGELQNWPLGFFDPEA